MMNKKIMLISLMSLAVIFLIGTVSAAEPTYNDQSAPCYACNSTECHCNNTCLCKDPNYENITKGDTRIRNDNGCYYCNESCDCPNNCSCKEPLEETSQQHNNFWDWLLSLFSKITNYNGETNTNNICGTDTNTTDPSVGPSSDNPSVSANPSVEPEQNDVETTDNQEQYDDNNPSDTQEEGSSSDTGSSQSSEYDESE